MKAKSIAKTSLFAAALTLAYVQIFIIEAAKHIR